LGSGVSRGASAFEGEKVRRTTLSDGKEGGGALEKKKNFCNTKKFQMTRASDAKCARQKKVQEVEGPRRTQHRSKKIAMRGEGDGVAVV